MEINHKWISANAYSKQTGLGIEKVKQFVRTRKIEGEITEDGYYKIKIYKHECISREQYEKIIKENEQLKTVLKNILSIVKEII